MISRAWILQHRKKAANGSNFAKCGTNGIAILMLGLTGYEGATVGQKE
jgi:hypothetical protein